MNTLFAKPVTQKMAKEISKFMLNEDQPETTEYLESKQPVTLGQISRQQKVNYFI
jgi:hypothetical protein